MRMISTELMAVCDGCHGRLLARRRKAGCHTTAASPASQEGLR